MKLGIAGAGQWGKNLIRNAHVLGILGGVFDVSPVRRAEIEQAYPGVRTWECFEDLLASDVEAAVIAAPADLHAKLGMQALHAGKHVFIEKPLALEIADARELVETAASLNRILFVGHLLLHHPAVTELLRLLRAGTIGDVRHVRLRRLGLGRVRTAEDVWWSFAPHDVAVMLEIFGEQPETGSGTQSAFVTPDIADFVHADFTFSGGRSAHIEVSWLDPARSQRLDVFGSEGVLTFTDDRVAGPVITLTECGAVLSGEVPDTWRKDSQTMPVPSGEPLRLELEHFLQAIVSGEPAITDGCEGLRVVETLAMIAPYSSTPRTEFIS